MSTELKGTESINGEVMLTRYFGGTEHGACLQVTPPVGAISGERIPHLYLTKEQALELAAALVEFVNGKCEEGVQ